jgi:hypothetical protein
MQPGAARNQMMLFFLKAVHRLSSFTQFRFSPMEQHYQQTFQKNDFSRGISVLQEKI